MLESARPCLAGLVILALTNISRLMVMKLTILLYDTYYENIAHKSKENKFLSAAS